MDNTEKAPRGRELGRQVFGYINLGLVTVPLALAASNSSGIVAAALGAFATVTAAFSASALLKEAGISFTRYAADGRRHIGVFLNTRERAPRGTSTGAPVEGRTSGTKVEALDYGYQAGEEEFAETSSDLEPGTSTGGNEVIPHD